MLRHRTVVEGSVLVLPRHPQDLELILESGSVLEVLGRRTVVDGSVLAVPHLQQHLGLTLEEESVAEVLGYHDMCIDVTRWSMSSLLC